MVSILDIIGPVMVGPSSSHTAGACRIGLLARALVGGTPQQALLELHGSFARTGEGHGTDKALAGGLLGFRPDDVRIREALDIAEREGLAFRFEKTTLADDAHPNSVRVTLTRGDRSAVAIGQSLGAGRVRLSDIDGYPVDVSGSFHTLVLTAEDRTGSIARITAVLAEDAINIATLRLSRRARGEDAFMVIECDDPIAESVCDDLRQLDWVHWVRALPKVSA